MDKKRANVINRKRAGVKEQLNELIALVEPDDFDKDNASLRLKYLTSLVEAYQPFHEELVQLAPNDDGVAEMKTMRDEFYRVGTRINRALAPPQQTSSPSLNIADVSRFSLASSTLLNATQTLKLPTASVPKFNGDRNKWLSFKSAFTTMIHERDDLNNLVKFVHLREALEGEPRNKIDLFDLTEENYQAAWDTILEAYNNKRVLIAKHLDALFEIIPLTAATSSSLTKLIDDVKQHVFQLKSLGVIINDEIVIRAIERALPLASRRRWEESIGSTEFPKIKIFYTFLNSEINQLTTMEHEWTRVKGERGNKRTSEREPNTMKKSRGEATRALVTSTKGFVCMCENAQNTHAPYRCPAFGQADIDDRWAFARKHDLCFNCLHKHRSECRATACKKCNQKHHTSLHREKDTSINRASDSYSSVRDGPSKSVDRRSASKSNERRS